LEAKSAIRAAEVLGDAGSRKLREGALQAVFDRQDDPRLSAIVLRLKVIGHFSFRA
jgi:hypothetical protein